MQCQFSLCKDIETRGLLQWVNFCSRELKIWTIEPSNYFSISCICTLTALVSMYFVSAPLLNACCWLFKKPVIWVIDCMMRLYWYEWEEWKCLFWNDCHAALVSAMFSMLISTCKAPRRVWCARSNICDTENLWLFLILSVDANEDHIVHWFHLSIPDYHYSVLYLPCTEALWLMKLTSFFLISIGISKPINIFRSLSTFHCAFYHFLIKILYFPVHSALSGD